MIKVMRGGATRTVFLVGTWAIKVPTLKSWRLFLNGLLCNMQEQVFWKGLHDAQNMMCPVLFYMPGGFFSVMRRAEPVDELRWQRNGAYWHMTARKLGIPVEDKLDSWGTIDGKLVAVDYGT